MTKIGICLFGISINGSTYDGDIVVKGWAVASSGIKEVDIYYDDNKPIVGISTLSEREDVQSIINPDGRYTDALHSGICYTIKHGTLPAGAHTLKIGAVPEDGSTACWGAVEITIK